ncbi:MAG TPA: inositol monophosphatase family protein, partial [Candidatus Saccharimonadia bacterium]|nr:inositol monophosphatase family protein [Candidatus Saccharimonadia bacterium]
MNTYLPFIQDALEAGAKIAAKNFGKVSGTVKGSDNNQVLTETDLEVGKLLVDVVRRQFPDHNVIDEEAGVIDRG